MPLSVRVGVGSWEHDALRQGRCEIDNSLIEG